MQGGSDCASGARSCAVNKEREACEEREALVIESGIYERLADRTLLLMDTYHTDKMLAVKQRPEKCLTKSETSSNVNHSVMIQQTSLGDGSRDLTRLLSMLHSTDPTRLLPMHLSHPCVLLPVPTPV